jgi:hypothetical protein
MKAIIFTQEVLDSIPVMVEQGLNRDEIAARIGTTTASLQVRCSQRKISLRKSGPRPPKRVEMPLTLSNRTVTILQKRAKARGCSEAKLAIDLLEMIVNDDLLDAVLDETL